MTDTHRSLGSDSSTLPVEEQADEDKIVRKASAPGASGSIPTSKEEQNSGRDESSGYISGIRLYAVLSSITLVMFLITLDQTIIVTVK